MGSYLFKRILLIFPTLLAIITLNFCIMQFVPGGPVGQMLVKLRDGSTDATERITGGVSDAGAEERIGTEGFSPEVVEKIEKIFKFDRPVSERYFVMLRKYLTFDLGESYFKDKKVSALILESMPISLSLGFWSILFIYLISIPLGIRKARKTNDLFDVITSTLIIIGYAIPGFLFAILLIIFFAGGEYLSWFPLKGIVSADWKALSWSGKVLDYFWHLTLPVLTIVVSGVAKLTLLTKNLFLEELHKNYVITARAKGLSENEILYKHVFKNAMLLIIAEFPVVFLRLFFTTSLLVEIIFSLNGMGLLGFEAIIHRDYPVLLGILYIYSLLSLSVHVVRDVMYSLLDPRIDFKRQEA